MLRISALCLLVCLTACSAASKPETVLTVKVDQDDKVVIITTTKYTYVTEFGAWRVTPGQDCFFTNNLLFVNGTKYDAKIAGR